MSRRRLRVARAALIGETSIRVRSLAMATARKPSKRPSPKPKRKTVKTGEWRALVKYERLY